MKKSDKRSQWEGEWSSAFEGASIKPSERVWESIDASLANQEVSRYKKKALFYQYLAAACFFLACGSIAFMLLVQNPLQEQQLADEANISNPANTGSTLNTTGNASTQPPAENPPKDKNTAAEKTPERGSAATTEGFAAEEGSGAQAAEDLAANGPRAGKAADRPSGAGDLENFASQAGDSGNMNTIAADEEGAQTIAELAAGKEPNSPAALSPKDNHVAAEAVEEQPGLQHIKGLAYLEDPSNPVVVQAHVSKVWMVPEMFKKLKEESAPRYLLGASVASNYFNPNFENNTGRSTLDAEPLKPSKGNQVSNTNLNSWNQEAVNQPSVNAGIQAAGWVGKKLVLQGGVQYGNYRSSTMAGTYVDAGTAQAYPLHYANFSADKIQTGRAGSRMAAPVEALNTFEFISVPLRIGYVVFDKKVGLLLSPGISSEIFLKNQISDQDRQLSTYTVYSGEESPFNTVHFRGTFGAQLYYKLSEHYLISIEPNYQHSITDFNKEGAMFRSRPSNLGLSAGFRYIIR